MPDSHLTSTVLLIKFLPVTNGVQTWLFQISVVQHCSLFYQTLKSMVIITGMCC